VAFNPVDHSVFGTSTAMANGVLCNPSTGTVTGILITGVGKAGVTTDSSAALTGVTNTSCGFVGGVTTMRWERPFDNGVTNFAQLSPFTPTRTQ
jgi:hypothetical protein